MTELGHLPEAPNERQSPISTLKILLHYSITGKTSTYAENFITKEITKGRISLHCGKPFITDWWFAWVGDIQLAEYCVGGFSRNSVTLYP